MVLDLMIKAQPRRPVNTFTVRQSGKDRRGGGRLRLAAELSSDDGYGERSKDASAGVRRNRPHGVGEASVASGTAMASPSAMRGVSGLVMISRGWVSVRTLSSTKNSSSIGIPAVPAILATVQDVAIVAMIRIRSSVSPPTKGRVVQGSVKKA